ncbi:putative thiopurine S-methyltransferase [Triplophysa tibetana]|uniref:thiopurine S-methyltransferase n=1 Tax=Triplophysa tibetana TaxID=1572043 RepID=A0A5A9NLK1_9TELE|nr:putative thiopurine S-methyltransferase [Triplophysa tibetana]
MSAQEKRVMALCEWEDRWQTGRTGFHQPQVHKFLKKYLDKILHGQKSIRFFFPLCGKAVDMKWLADMGHTVTGVEISEKGIKQFFEDQSLRYSEEQVPEIPGAKVFKSADGKISIYQCDLYKFSSAIAGKFGGIWDRGAMVAINPCDRQKYAALLTSLMESDCRYLIDTLEYNPEQYKGPPFLVTEDVLKQLFEGACDIELLQTADGFEERHRAWGIDNLTEKVYLLTPKKQ